VLLFCAHNPAGFVSSTVSCNSALCLPALRVLNGCASCVQCTSAVVVLLFRCALALGVFMLMLCHGVRLPYPVSTFSSSGCCSAFSVCATALFSLMCSCSDSALVFCLCSCVLFFLVCSCSVCAPVFSCSRCAPALNVLLFF
jgi:hypothetical protein